MWRPGKWVYVEDDPASKSKSPKSDSDPAAAQPHDPPSPPWKLGQVPTETAVFKDGRRMSKRFEKLHKDRDDLRSKPPPSRKERSKSTISPPKPSQSARRPRKHSAATSQTTTTTTTTITTPTTTPLIPSGSAQPAEQPPHPDPLEPNVGKSPCLPSTPPAAIPLDQEPTSSLPQPQPQPKPQPPLVSPTSLAPDFLSSAHRLPQPLRFDCPDKSISSAFTDAVAHEDDVQPLTPGIRLAHPPDTATTATTDRPEITKDEPELTKKHPEMTHDEPQITSDQPGTAEVRTTAAESEPIGEQAGASDEPETPPAIGNYSDPPDDAGGLDEEEACLPVKKFKPWEALKGIATDGAEVAGDLKLIHERQHRVPLSKSNLVASGSGGGCGRSSSSSLTELSSSLSSLSDTDMCSSSASLVLSDSEAADSCLPDTLVRTVRRPSRAETDISRALRWKKRQSAARRARRDEKQPQIEVAAGDGPPPYTKIKANVYPFRKPEVSELPPAMCGCTEDGCGEKCINRAMFYLCDPKQCLLGQSCTNIPFNQRKDLIDESSLRLGKGLKVFYTGPQRGWGLKTEIRLKQGRLVIDYRGEVISREKCYARVLNEYRGKKDFFFLDYDGSDVIDAGKKGNCSRFINHSCEPNLRVERYKLSGLEEYQFGLFTLREIEVDEELCYNYGWQNFSDLAPTSDIRTRIQNDPDAHLPSSSLSPATAPTVQRCFCGTLSCTGFLGVRKPGAAAKERRRGTKKRTREAE